MKQREAKMIPLHLFARLTQYSETRPVYATDQPGWYTDGAQMVLLGDAGATLAAPGFTKRTVNATARYRDSATLPAREQPEFRLPFVDGKWKEQPCPVARRGLLPTPTVHGNNNRAGLSPASGDGLRTVIGGPLNPQFLEWLMGFPLGWTAIDASAMQLFRKSRRSRGNSSKIAP